MIFAHSALEKEIGTDADSSLLKKKNQSPFYGTENQSLKTVRLFDFYCRTDKSS